jgi:adenylate cyclase
MVGDEIMALFIPGVCGARYRQLAVEAAEALVRAVRDQEVFAAPLPIGVSVHAGPAFVGNVGSPGVTDFTALGDTVNTAARLRSMAEAGTVVMSEAVYAAVERRLSSLERQVLPVRGRHETIGVRTLRVQ